jgi:hypothetical protein
MRKTSLFFFYFFFLQKMKFGEIRTDQLKSGEIKLTTSKFRPGRTYSGRPFRGRAWASTPAAVTEHTGGRLELDGGGGSSWRRGRQLGPGAEHTGGRIELDGGGGSSWRRGRQIGPGAETGRDGGGRIDPISISISRPSGGGIELRDSDLLR